MANTKEIYDTGVRLRQQVGQDLLAKRINKEELARRVAQIDTEVGQRLSVLEAGEGDVAVEESQMQETTGASGAQGTSRESGLRAPKVPTKRKSDDSLGGLRVVTGIGYGTGLRTRTGFHHGYIAVRVRVTPNGPANNPYPQVIPAACLRYGMPAGL